MSGATTLFGMRRKVQPRLTITGSLSKTASGSSTVTSDAVTINVDPGHSGELIIEDVITDVGANLQYQKNADGWNTAVGGEVITFADGDQFYLRGQTLDVGESVQCDVHDNDFPGDPPLQTPVITRS